MSKTTNHPPVPVPQAIEMTTNWRDYYASITGTSPEDAFRGFTIPLDDLEALVDMAKKDLNITAVRAYLALGEAATANGVDANEIHLLLLPVSDNTPAGTDILEVDHDGLKISTIQDFTKPCPALCDVTSPLYGPQIP